MQPALAIEQLSKTYEGGFQALKDISLTVQPGDFFALLGPNGAGKSTLIKLIAGVLKADSMSIEKNGQPLSVNDARDAHEAGFRFIHQELNIIPQVSVAENVLLGRDLPRKYGLAVEWNKVKMLSLNLRLCSID